MKVSKYMLNASQLGVHARQEFVGRTMAEFFLKDDGGVSRRKLKKNKTLLNGYFNRVLTYAKEKFTICGDMSYVKRVKLFMELNDVDEDRAWDIDTAERFLAWHHMVYATVHGTNKAKSVISQWHLDNKWVNPFDTHRCKKFTCAIMKLDPVPARAAKLPFPIVTWKKWLKRGDNINTMKVYKLMSSALIAIGLCTMARGKELVELEINNIEFKEDGMWIRFKKTKTKSKGRLLWIDNASVSEFCLVVHLKRWMRYQAKIFAVEDSSPLFVIDGKQLSTNRITSILQWVAKCCKDGNKYTAHSLRAGGATEAAFQGLSQSAIAGIGDWTTDLILAYFKSSISGRKISDEMGFH